MWRRHGAAATTADWVKDAKAAREFAELDAVVAATDVSSPPHTHTSNRITVHQPAPPPYTDRIMMAQHLFNGLRLCPAYMWWTRLLYAKETQTKSSWRQRVVDERVRATTSLANGADTKGLVKHSAL